MYVPLGALHLLKITCFLFCSQPFGTDGPPLFLTFEMTAVRKHSTCILTTWGYVCPTDGRFQLEVTHGQLEVGPS